MSDVILEQVIALAVQLSPVDKVRLMERVASTLENDLSAPDVKPRETFKGVLANLGPAPTDEAIEEVRREMWRNFPHEDIGT